MKLNRLLSVLLALVIIFAAYTFPVEAEDNIKVVLNEMGLSFDVPPQLINDRTMGPMRKIFEALDCEVRWDEDTQTISAVCEVCKTDEIAHSTTMKIGDPYMYTYRAKITPGELPPPGMARIELDAPPMLVGGRTLVPVRAIAESFHATVDWDGETQTVVITSTDGNAETEEVANFLTGWKKIAAEDMDSDEWYDANWSNNAGCLYIEENTVKLSQSPVISDMLHFDTSSGYISGTNHGEFGGSLEYHDKDGTSYILSDKVIPVAIFSYNNEIYLLDGLAHLGLSSGSISRIVMKDGRWSIVDTVDLGAAPDAYFEDKESGNFFIVTTMSIIKADLSQKEIQFEVLTEISSMSGLYPSSIVKHKNYIYISMRRAVLTFNIDTKDVFFYINENIPTTRRKN